MDYSQYTTTSSASSPFSQLSTDASSPEANTSAGETKTPPPAQTYGNEMMQTVNSNFNQAYGHMIDVKPQINGSGHINNAQIPAPSAFRLPANGHQSVASSSRPPSSHGGARADKPTRRYPIENIPSTLPTIQDLYAGPTSKGLVLLQGDPQAITKQRVETAIRAIIDLLHFVPPSVAPIPTDPNLLTLLPRGPNGQPTAHLARIGTFKTLRLQAGTTTKQMSKKQEQIKEHARKQLKDPSALDSTTVYLETAVYKEDGRTRVYACKRCRAREEKRRKSKESSRKNPLSVSESSKVKTETDTSPRPMSESSPSPEYITGHNAHEYDPMRPGQVVQEPIWNPDVSDWRHEIIMFNNSPEMPIKESGTIDWLPFRVICYGKCHGEKTGFRIKFTVRTRDGRILGSDTTEPIRITDDHKTDKAKPRMEISRAPAVPRSRKGTSAMSSRRASPTASDDSLQSFSEAGAVVQKQIPHNRAKPYERPSLPRQHSGNSVHSAASMSAISTNNHFPDVPPSSAEWPNVLNQNQSQQAAPNINLRRPFNGTMTPLNADTSSFTSSNPPSIHSSAVQSPIGLQPMVDHDDIPNELASRFSALGQSLNQTQPMNFQSTNPMLFDGFSNPPYNGMTNDTSDMFSASSYTSSFASDHSGLGLYNDDSVFSDSGLRPESTDDENDQMMNYLNIPDGVDSLSQPFGGFASPSPNPPNTMTGAPPPMTYNHQIPPPSEPQQPAPMISAVIPPNGPMSGGPDIAIIGMNLPAGAVVLFGGRAAETKASNPAVVQCVLPPGISPGLVEVTIQGYGRQTVCGSFTYDGVTKEAMELALKVQGQYPSASNGAQMPPTLQPSMVNGTINSVMNSVMNGGGGGGGGGGGWSGPSPPKEEDLQVTFTNFLASMDQHAPGSLRHSGAINVRNLVQQTLLHLATILGYHRLLRRLIVYGAKLDFQDINGLTPLAFAAYCGKVDCARVLIEAGAKYDLTTNLGELPLDLAKISGDAAVENLLLSAVWSTRSQPIPVDPLPLEISQEDAEIETESESINSELDNDNPSDGSEDEEEVDAFIDRPPRRRRSRHRSKRPHISIPDDRSIQANPADSVRRSPSSSSVESLVSASIPPAPLSSRPAHLDIDQTTGVDSPPPYSPASWLDKIPLTEHWIPLVPSPIASMFHHSGVKGEGKHSNQAGASGSSKASTRTTTSEAGWVTLPVPSPSWETLQRMTSPEEVKLFTQAMAAAALNAVVQSGATTTMEIPTSSRRSRERRKKRRSSGSGSASTPNRSQSGGPSDKKVVKQVKKDRMLFFFWLPILLFFGFWIVVTALPIITGFGLIYARSITRYIKQRM